MNEADTRAKLIDPMLRQAGWSEDLIEREYMISPGRIYATEQGDYRDKPRKVDYLLRYQGLPIAVVEAKPDTEAADVGIQQAKAYAELLGSPFAYSTNGREVVGFNFLTNQYERPEAFPSPEELWSRLEKAGHPATQEPERNPLLEPFYIQGGRRPRYYQERAVNIALAAFLEGRKRILLTLATGTGKTFIAFQIVWKLFQTNRIRRVLFLADRLILRDQAYIAFEPFGEARYILEAGDDTKGRNIYFSIYQSLYAGDPPTYKRFPPEFFDLVIVDEAHRSGYGTWRDILDHFGSAVHLGLTATPKRNDNIDTYAYFGEPVYRYSLADGIADGYLAAYRVYQVRTNLDRDGLWVEEEGQLYTTKDFERVIRVPERNQTIARHLVETLKALGTLNSRTMVFCVDQAHAREMAQLIQNEAAASGLNRPNFAAAIVSEDSEARRLLRQFQDPEAPTPMVATSVDILTTGVDVPQVRNIVFLRPVGSQVAFKQILGRGSRLAPEKLSFNVLDYTGATEHFKDPEWLGEPEVKEVGEIRKAAPQVEKGGSKEEKEAKREEKRVLQGVTVYIAEETYFELTADGRQLDLRAYMDYAREVLTEVLPEPKDLAKLWTHPKGRETILKTLESRGIPLEALTYLVDNPEVDPYDLLLHLAYGHPLHLREDRVLALRNKHQELLNRYGPKARAVLEALLEKYRLVGLEALEDPQTLRTPPLDQFGGPAGISRLFGGPNLLKKAIKELKNALYA
jgi:type I restriction enzyme R subunit